MSFITYQIKKLVPQSIIVKTTSRSDRLWSFNFSLMVYSKLSRLYYSVHFIKLRLLLQFLVLRLIVEGRFAIRNFLYIAGNSRQRRRHTISTNVGVQYEEYNIPHIYHDIPHGTEYPTRYSRYPPHAS